MRKKNTPKEQELVENELEDHSAIIQESDQEIHTQMKKRKEENLALKKLLENLNVATIKNKTEKNA